MRRLVVGAVGERAVDRLEVGAVVEPRVADIELALRLAAREQVLAADLVVALVEEPHADAVDLERLLAVGTR